MKRNSKRNLLYDQEFAFYKAVLEQSPDGYSLLNSEGDFVGVNRAFCDLSGYSEFELLSMNLKDLVPPEIPLTLFPRLVEGQSGEGRIKILRKNGDLLQTSIKGSSLTFHDQTFFLGIVTDITAQYDAEGLLRASEAKYRTLFDSAPDPIVIHDGKSILDLNQATLEALSLENKEQVLGIDPMSLLHPEDQDRGRQRISQLMNNGKTLPPEEFRILLHNNGERIVVASPTLISFGGKQAVMVNYHDITERKAILEALQKSEENYRNVVQDQTEYIMRYLPDGSITFVNDSFCRAFHTTFEEATTQNITIGNRGSEIVRVKNKIKALSADNPIIVDEHQSITPDGKQVWHLWLDRGIFDGQGKLTEIQAVGRDVTARKQIEESLQASTTQLEEAQRMANIGSYILDIQNDKWTGGTILYEMFGIVETQELTVAAWSDIVHPDDRDEMNAYFAACVSGKQKRFDKEYRIINKKDHSLHWVHGHGRFTFDSHGNPLKMIGVIQDITERKLAEREREQALFDAQAANRVKDQFIANISHEIRTPLNSLLGFSDILNQKHNEFNQEEDVDIFNHINSASKRLMRTVDSMVNISQLEAGYIKIFPETFDLIVMAKAVLDESFPIAREKELAFNFNTRLKTAKVHADVYSIQQVITNLLDNAIKFTPKGSVTVEIGKQAQRIYLSVMDTGIGMSADYQKRIFEPYTQESEGFTKNYQGLGLGMALTRRYVDLNNVDIELKSEMGVGTTCTLIFPAYGGGASA
jgi:PAS domain S-box-containing protein